MSAAVMAAAFEHVYEALNVAVDVGVRIAQRVPYAGLRGEMDYVGEAMLGEKRRHAVAISEIELDEAKCLGRGELRATCVLQLRIVIGVEVVEPDHRMAVGQQPARNMKADETGRARDQDRLCGHRYIRHSVTPSGFWSRSSFALTSMTMPLPFFSRRRTSDQPAAT